MTSGEDERDQIVRAGHRVTVAADQWNAVDLATLGNCLSTLECAAAELRNALEIMRGSPTKTGRALESSVLDLKKAAVRLERLADSSASFLRCAPGLSCDEPGLYGAGGSMRYTAPVAETRGMQV